MAVSLAGIVAYFVVGLRFGAALPDLRNHVLANWIVVAVGLALSISALGRSAAGRSTAPAVLLALNVVAAGAFAALLYVVTAVPGGRPPSVGAPAPDFTVVDQAGSPVRLADFRGRPLLLVFYRGHW